MYFGSGVAQQGDYGRGNHGATTAHLLNTAAACLTLLADAVEMRLRALVNAAPSSTHGAHVGPPPAPASQLAHGPLFARTVDAIVGAYVSKDPLSVGLAVAAFTASLLASVTAVRSLVFLMVVLILVVLILVALLLMVALASGGGGSSVGGGGAWGWWGWWW